MMLRVSASAGSTAKRVEGKQIATHTFDRGRKEKGERRKEKGIEREQSRSRYCTPHSSPAVLRSFCVLIVICVPLVFVNTVPSTVDTQKIIAPAAPLDGVVQQLHETCLLR